MKGKLLLIQNNVTFVCVCQGMARLSLKMSVLMHPVTQQRRMEMYQPSISGQSPNLLTQNWMLYWERCQERCEGKSDIYELVFRPRLSVFFMDFLYILQYPKYNLSPCISPPKSLCVQAHPKPNTYFPLCVIVLFGSASLGFSF